MMNSRISICVVLLAVATCALAGDKLHDQKCRIKCSKKFVGKDCPQKCAIGTGLVCHDVKKRCVCPDTFHWDDQEELCSRGVLEVKQNYANRMDSDLQLQLNIYNKLELVYKLYAAYFERADVALPGFAKYFRGHSAHMAAQANIMMGYINERGGFVFINTVKIDDACETVSKSLTEFQVSKSRTEAFICDFQRKVTPPNKNIGKDEISTAGLYGLEDAVAMEKFIHENIYFILRRKNSVDAFSKHFLESLLIKERITAMTALLNKLRGFPVEDYVMGEYDMDLELAK